MAFIHRALFLWFLVLGFIILFTLKLEKRIREWNWFIVFIPMWVFDSVVIVYILMKMVMRCRNIDYHETTWKRKIWCMSGMFMKVLFQVLICLRLEYFHHLRLLYVTIPFWIFNIGCVLDVFTNLRKLARKQAP